MVSSILAAVVIIFVLPTISVVNAKVTTFHTVEPNDWVQECASVFQDLYDPSSTLACVPGGGAYPINYSSYDLIGAPSGLCVPSFSCAYSQCMANNYKKSPTSCEEIDNFVSDFVNMTTPITSDTTYADVESVLGPGLDLPKAIVFPTDPSDIVTAIQHAKDVGEGMTVSIKTTGHSYTGAFTAANSVQLNLRDYPKYSTMPGAIVECDNNIDIDNAISDDDTATCKLAMARGKKAFIRAGGGELFNTTVSSVFALKSNKTFSNYDTVNETYAKYILYHGSAGSVGTAGGWLQGGGLSDGLQRMVGLGVDQVLEIEMVLPDTTHVKFYPTEWEDSEGFLYPKTTKVGGLCNTNVFAEDESMWKWETCKDTIPFEDLWFAVRGGGGGTYGVLTSVKLQLHENRPYYIFFKASLYDVPVTISNEAILSNLTEDEQNEYNDAHNYCTMNFALDFLFNPDNLNISHEISNSCAGESTLNFDSINFFCFGEDAANILLKTYGENMVSCLTKDLPVYLDYGLDIPNEYILDGPTQDFDFRSETVNGVVQLQSGNTGSPSIIPSMCTFPDFWSSALVPASWLAGMSNESTADLLKETYLTNPLGLSTHITGGNVAIAHDQMNAIPATERKSGVATQIGFNNLSTDLQERILQVFLNEAITNGDNFPGISEFNHICSGSYGPLRSNMTKPCPQEYTTEEKDEKCYRSQEMVWGVDLTAKLENIKYKFDPDNLFKCNGCIQPKKSISNDIAATTTTTDVPAPATTDPATDIPEEDPSPVIDESLTSSSSSSSSSLLTIAFLTVGGHFIGYMC